MGLRVYLAGSLESGWQDLVVDAVPSARYDDPRSNALLSPKAYTTWNLAAIRRCDCIFAYLEATNPSGYGLTLEVGYAKALGKCIILVDEKTIVGSPSARYFDIIASCADVHVHSLEDGLNFLKQYKRLVY